MKRMRRLFAVSAMILVLLNVWPQICNAQADPGDDPDAPIDGGIGLLIAAGVGYGLKKANEKRKKANMVNMVEKDK